MFQNSGIEGDTTMMNSAKHEGQRNSGLPPTSESRRGFLQMAAGGAVSGWMAATGLSLGIPPSAMAQSDLTPDAALQRLIEGNQRFASGNMTAHEHDMAILKAKNASGQEPFAALLSCADSRVPVELLFDESLGHIFVTRVAGNIATPEIIASLEFGAGVLGTKVIMVMGHSGCGAVKAAIQGSEVPGQISALYPHIRPAVNQAGPDLEATTKANAKIQAALLRQASTVLSGLVKEKKLKVLASYFDIASGRVTLLE
jgi:carbonic anhydrase